MWKEGPNVGRFLLFRHVNVRVFLFLYVCGRRNQRENKEERGRRRTGGRMEKKRGQKRNEFWNRYRADRGRSPWNRTRTEERKGGRNRRVSNQVKSSRCRLMRPLFSSSRCARGPSTVHIYFLSSPYSPVFLLFSWNYLRLHVVHCCFLETVSAGLWPVPPPSAGSRLVPPSLWEWSLKHKNGPHLMALANIQTGGSGSLLDVHKTAKCKRNDF